jgi:hypothetical protein
MVVIVAGGRDLSWAWRFEEWLETLHSAYVFHEVVVGSNNRDPTGQRRGADAHAKAWAERLGIDTTVMDANWTKFGRGAGPRRNTRMLWYLNLISDATQTPAMVLTLPGGKGTADLASQAAAFGIPVLAHPNVPSDLRPAA